MNETKSISPARDEMLNTGRVLQTTLSVAILVATLFVGFSPKMFSGDINAIISNAINPQTDQGVSVTTQINTVRIGIVSGHWGNGDDPGAVCADGTNEKDVNLAVSTLVRQKLEARGYQVDMLQEFDPKLDGYEGALLLSIHSDTCDAINSDATGFKVASSAYSTDRNLADRLTACLEQRYGVATGLQYRPGNITIDMTDYHAFSVINPVTTAGIIEIGFLNLDKDLLVNHPDTVAEGVTAGVLCFVTNESVQALSTPSP
jgi:N-acetylmuramoyl-L-alanine amidase